MFDTIDFFFSPEKSLYATSSRKYVEKKFAYYTSYVIFTKGDKRKAVMNWLSMNSTMRLAKFILMLLLTRTALLCSSQVPYLYVNLHPYSVGMFSVFSYVGGVLYHYDNGDYSGIEVDFENFGHYYDSAYGPNWWEYFCEPIRLGNKEDAYVKRFSVSEYEWYAYFLIGQLSRQQVYELIQKYIKIRENIQKKIDQFVLEDFTD
ncbi:MAG: hypothetical protein K940chlam6_00783 [Chlamydiae bacterium]|nr:hypothetical protein [Chlamydiota bacterium]